MDALCGSHLGGHPRLGWNREGDKQWDDSLDGLFHGASNPLLFNLFGDRVILKFFPEIQEVPACGLPRRRDPFNYGGYPDLFGALHALKLAFYWANPFLALGENLRKRP